MKIFFIIVMISALLCSIYFPIILAKRCDEESENKNER